MPSIDVLVSVDMWLTRDRSRDCHLNGFTTTCEALVLGATVDPK